ncbi:anthranilate 1,2-dioxygenase ferredoxin subunit AndAb [Roseomonas indoligenes]|uniref:Rieske 2Fe-2S domain-containing protein n=1 Tax=Roseomonas indoligenes TaxID=2820811 RepID=A0A940MT24_9PROT|nr:anthranilate 1,2-dioxygenase ferredoxin subunit AndAb [Pararoseomonas indoligenes]MBP0491183.1 Rieske 2Fe-2S domain-containing protein [Pararoseomonas indoligenes]
MGEWHDAAAADAVVEDEVVGCVVAGKPVALFRVEGQVHALYDQCSHGYAKLSDGFVEDGCVECPLHQGLVDILTGEPRSAPITEGVRSFPAREVNGRVEVEIE